MAIRRTAMSWEGNFVQLPNHWARDARLSRRARGLLAEIMSHRAGWDITIEHLVENGPEGIFALRQAIRELEVLGYLKRDRNRQSDGTLAGMDYVLCEPVTENAVSPIPAEPILAEPILADQRERTLSLKNTSSSEDHAPVSSKQSRRTASSLLPDDFVVTAEMQAWARDNAPHADLVWEGKKFKNHWLGQRKADWPRAWRNWMLKAEEYWLRDNGARAAAQVPTDVRTPLTFRDPYLSYPTSPVITAENDPWAKADPWAKEA